jgi:DNA-binding NarL/FixJ family response regulator
MLYLAIETDDIGVLAVIRAALPQGSRLHVGRVPGRVPEAGLTARQRQILGCLAEGLSNKEIGRKLSLSHFTVRNHVSTVMRLLDASTRQEIVARMAEAAPDPGTDDAEAGS